jgi:uncharacterized protein YbbC (DUF1343 family)
MQLGLDQLPDYLASHASGTRIGLLCHGASVDSRGQHVTAIAAGSQTTTLTTLFAPEHGLTGAAADMEAVDTVVHEPTGCTIHSLYGSNEASLQPSAEALGQIDLLVIDLQDIGTRYYTYSYTMAYCLEACAEAKIPVVVCDRPNPINGVTTEGPVQHDGFQSFVGRFPLPVRHGKTIGELATMFNDSIHAALTVLPMEGWNRHWHWHETGLVWKNPSPNMRSSDAALLYPGACLLEGTNVSEGRGTDIPFLQCGAPWIAGSPLVVRIAECDIPGLEVRPISFTPHARKFSGEFCEGVRFHVTDRKRFRPYRFGLALLWALAQSREFGWRTPAGNPPHTGLDAGPYEFNTEHPAIDLLTGSAQVRTAIDRGADLDTLLALAD